VHLGFETHNPPPRVRISTLTNSLRIGQEVYDTVRLTGCGKKAFQNGFDTIQCGL
jgi:hypothetical protein